MTTIVFSPRARDDLLALESYLAASASPAIAARYVDSIVDFCLSLSVFPQRGIRRDDIRPGLRITNYRRRTVIAFDVDDGWVTILGIYHGGRDYEAEMGT